jgi:hypothetical protein
LVSSLPRANLFEYSSVCEIERDPLPEPSIHLNLVAYHRRSLGKSSGEGETKESGKLPGHSQSSYQGAAGAGSAHVHAAGAEEESRP